MAMHKVFAAWFKVWGVLLCVYLLGLVVWVAAGMYFAGVVGVATLSAGEAIGLVGFGMLGVAWYGIPLVAVLTLVLWVVLRASAFIRTRRA
jgi:hypothetical protein